MKIFSNKYFLLFLFIVGIVAMPLFYAQGQSVFLNKKPFIHKGDILAGFSFSFSNASGRGYGFNSGVPDETTTTSIQLDGLYFVSGHVGIGPLLGYQFRYIDWSNFDAHNGQFLFGAQGGYYVPFSELFNSSSRIYFFVSGGISWLRVKYPVNNLGELQPEYDIGFRIGPGLLFPVGKRIAIQTALQLQTRKQKYSVFNSGTNVSSTTYRWPISVGLSVGLKVKF